MPNSNYERSVAAILEEHDFACVCADVELYDKYGYWATDIPVWFRELVYDLSLIGNNEQALMRLTRQWISKVVSGVLEGAKS